MRILFTGGGSAGHVTPNIALIGAATRRGWSTVYVGSQDGIERELIAHESITYHGIRSGKLRRYFSWQNFIDPFNVLAGFCQALLLLVRERPDAVFSKGGFVAVPVVVAAWMLRIPVLCHESDIVPGLANRLCRRFSHLMCVNFPETESYLPSQRVEVTGTPLRDDILRRNSAAARTRLGMDRAGVAAADHDLPVLLVFGGSLGAERINAAVAASLPDLLARFEVVHVCGAGGLPAQQPPGYHAFEYVHEGFGDLLELADLVVSRAGANALYELLVLRKPHVLIPLSAAVSRGDQVVNARVMEQSGYSVVVADEALDGETLRAALNKVDAERTGIMAALERFPARLDAGEQILDLLAAAARA